MARKTFRLLPLVALAVALLLPAGAVADPVADPVADLGPSPQEPSPAADPRTAEEGGHPRLTPLRRLEADPQRGEDAAKRPRSKDAPQRSTCCSASHPPPAD